MRHPFSCQSLDSMLLKQGKLVSQSNCLYTILDNSMCFVTPSLMVTYEIYNGAKKVTIIGIRKAYTFFE
jgi:hypothetical protein